MMRTSSKQVEKAGTIVGRIMIALVFVLMIGGLSLEPVFARDNDRGRGRHERGRYDHRPYGHYNVYRPYGYYQAPVYAPPPVVYAPAPYQSPGISLVFPIRIR